MIFSDAIFLCVFLPFVYLIHLFFVFIKSRQSHLLFLVISSLLFYLWWDVNNLSVFAFSIFTNFVFGILIEKYNRNVKLLFASVTFNVLYLVFFKYINLLIPSNQLNIVLPLAISFFTFHQIAYLVDIYRYGNAEKKFLNYLFFVSFFPHLVAGPILNYRDIRIQLEERAYNKVSIHQAIQGLSLLIIGLVKKTIIADLLAAPLSNAVFAQADANITFDSFTAIAGILAFYLQIYFDFSGYSDMAIGLGILFGIKFPVNFNSPYLASSILEFWRKWHISLSRFLKDYIYIPLGGSKKGEIVHYINIMITMLIGGIWHGANWTFLAWGGMHGLMMIVNQFLIYRGYIGKQKNSNKLNVILGIVTTNIIVALLWVLFRAQDFTSAATLYQSLITGFDLHSITDLLRRTYEMDGSYSKIISKNINLILLQRYQNLILPILFLITTASLFRVNNSQNYITTVPTSPIKMLNILLMSMMVMLVLFLQMNSNSLVNPFIYFQF
ncbi:TPA: MBOAT family protein [Legionella pneumophila]|nr:MBOAT family protein [Legionella pneumophila]HAU1847979.1 MBOAT family protein [Legionella pneumophila]